MRVTVSHKCPAYPSYRAARVRSLFNCEDGHLFSAHADLPIDGEWSIGAIVGPSGSGKSSLGAAIWGRGYVAKLGARWPSDQPIIDAIAPDDSFDAATAALTAVGLGSVPAWLRPYKVLSTGEQFRAGLARIVADPPDRVVIDEFTSVVDRRIAQVGAAAFARAWRRTGGRVVVLSCHRDILDWLEPDWVYDTDKTDATVGRSLWRRPEITLTIEPALQRAWGRFSPHHYLTLPRMIAATNYIGVIEGEPVAHISVSTMPGLVEARASRLVILPEWQGIGVGMRFLNAVCELWRAGHNRHEIKVPTLFHTSHPGLCAGLRRDQKWTQLSATLHGGRKARSGRSIARAAAAVGKATAGCGFGGHFRAVQGFRYWGPR